MWHICVRVIVCVLMWKYFYFKEHAFFETGTPTKIFSFLWLLRSSVVCNSNPWLLTLTFGLASSAYLLWPYLLQSPCLRPCSPSFHYAPKVLSFFSAQFPCMIIIFLFFMSQLKWHLKDTFPKVPLPFLLDIFFIVFIRIWAHLMYLCIPLFPNCLSPSVSIYDITKHILHWIPVLRTVLVIQ